jgi:hypothetical protein
MIFLSYNWKDHVAAHAIDVSLRGLGIDVWIDFRKLDPRSNIAQQLDIAIRNCSLFFAIQSSQRHNSAWMDLEFLIARKHAKPILQLVT